jgi:IS30 family transposase
VINHHEPLGLTTTMCKTTTTLWKHSASPQEKGNLMNELSEKHHQTALLVATTTLEKQEIARRVGVHPNTVTRALKLPEMQAPAIVSVTASRVAAGLCNRSKVQR